MKLSWIAYCFDNHVINNFIVSLKFFISIGCDFNGSFIILYVFFLFHFPPPMNPLPHCCSHYLDGVPSSNKPRENDENLQDTSSTKENAIVFSLNFNNWFKRNNSKSSHLDNLLILCNCYNIIYDSKCNWLHESCWWEKIYHWNMILHNFTIFFSVRLFSLSHFTGFDQWICIYLFPSDMEGCRKCTSND